MRFLSNQFYIETLSADLGMEIGSWKQSFNKTISGQTVQTFGGFALYSDVKYALIF